MRRPAEQRFRRHILTALRPAFGRRIDLPKLRPEELRRVLLIRYDRLGDAVITTPAIEALKMLAPSVEIDVIASRLNRSLFEHDPRVTNVHLWSDSPRTRIEIIRRCRARRYDAVFQLILGRTTLPSILSGMLAPHGRTIGKEVIDHEHMFNHTVTLERGLHYADMTLAVVVGGLQIDTPLPFLPYSVELRPEERERAREAFRGHGITSGAPIVLNISAGSSERELTSEQNIELARGFATLGHPVIVTGAPSAGERAAKIAAASGGHVFTSASIFDAMACMEMARLVVTPDTATVHMASAMRAPTVAMYVRGGDPTGWGPRGVPHRIVKAQGGDHLSEIDITEVLHATADLLNETGVTGRATPA